MKRLRGTQRYERIWSVNLWNSNSLNWIYTASFYLNWQFADWNQAGLTNVIDMQIPEERYTSEIYPWIKKLTRFVACEYNELYVDPVELQRSIENVGRRFDIDIFETPAECIVWIKDNTDLAEETPWNFVLSEEMIWLNNEIYPKQYLVIE